MDEQLSFFEEKNKTITVLLSLREEYFNQMLDGIKNMNIERDI